MVNDDQRRTVSEIIGERLQSIRTVTGIPVLFGGSTFARPGGGEAIMVARAVGAVTDALNHLRVESGRGLGGAALVRKEPLLVHDYASCQWITHEYDAPIIEHERITSMVAVPITLDDRVRGVVYGATRAVAPLGERAVNHAVTATTHLQRELDALFHIEQRRGKLLDNRAALDELTAIIAATRDPRMKAQLERVRRQLDREPPATGGHVGLTPREVEVLRLVAEGNTNADIGARLDLSPATVKGYVRDAMRKLEARTRTAAVHHARRGGLL